MKTVSKYIVTLAVVTGVSPVFAQQAWDLKQCIDYAIEHNLTVKQQEATRDQNEEYGKMEPPA